MCRWSAREGAAGEGGVVGGRLGGIEGGGSGGGEGYKGPGSIEAMAYSVVIANPFRRVLRQQRATRSGEAQHTSKHVTRAVQRLVSEFQSRWRSRALAGLLGALLGGDGVCAPRAV